MSGGILTVSQNKLSASSSGMITYICYISYYDSETKNTVNISSDITFTLVKNAENAKLAYVTADTYVFKYDTSGALVGATQATLTGQVQGVTISKWQYKNSSGNWADYPTTSDNASITGGTLVVKPAHAVFVNNVAQIKLVTSDADVYDTVTITKIYDGTKGDPGTPGSSGSGGLSVILSNEAQTIPCTSGGAVTAATNVTIPFTAYEGIEQKAATCTVGTLPSGVTVKSNTPATATAAGSVVLTFAKNAILGGASVLTGTIPLTFSVSGKSVTKNFAWTKANAGTSGTSAVVFSVYAPNGTIVQNQSGSLTLATSAYEGATAITNATYQWAKYSGGTWANISGATAATLTVQGADIVNIQSYRCTMTYNSKSYVDVITVEDKSDPYVSEMLSIGGFTVKNNLGGLVPYVIVRTNQHEVDPLKAQAEGLSAAQVGGTVNMMLSGKEATTLDVDGDDVSVMVEYADDEYDTIDKVRGIVLQSPTGSSVALTDIADIYFKDSPTFIIRDDREYRVTISGSFSDAVTEKEKKSLEAQIYEETVAPNLIAGIERAGNQQMEMQNEEFGSLGKAILTAIFLVFVVMAAQFESPKFSFMVMTTIPFSLIGVFGSLFLFDVSISMTSLLGFLMLVGTVVNAGILYVDTANLYKNTMDVDTALIEAGATRLRPILMTTLTTVLSMIPMALGLGRSGEVMQGLAMVNVGGLFASTLLSLLMLPVYYKVMNRGGHK